MAADYKKVEGLEALEREFNQLTKQVRPIVKSGPGLFSTAVVSKPAQISMMLFNFSEADRHLHALISVQAEKGEPLIKYYDLGDKPKMAPENIREMARKFIEACHKKEDWHTYFSDHREVELRAFAEWTAASVNERPASPPLSQPKASVDERIEDARRFVEGVVETPRLMPMSGKP